MGALPGSCQGGLPGHVCICAKASGIKALRVLREHEHPGLAGTSLGSGEQRVWECTTEGSSLGSARAQLCC